MSERRVDPDQWDEAVADCHGPQLVVAGPGTGKTEFLVRRALYVIESGLADPHEVLIISFTRRGARRLRSRVEAGLDRSFTEIPASTFHSLCFRLLETHAGDAFGWHEMPTLLTGPEQVELVAEILAAETPEAWPFPFRGILDTHTFAQEVTDFILRAREHLLDPAGLADRGRGRDDWRALPAFLETYGEELRARSRIDYGTLQAEAVRLLSDPAVRERVAERFRFILVDEYQDTTRAQAALLEGLTARHRNLTVAADPYQSVYSFRGAELENVEEFPDRFRTPDGEPARRVILTTSFRAPREILEAAHRVTAGGRLPGAAGPVVPAAHEGRVEGHVFDQQSHEAEWIAAEAHRLHLVERVPFARMAVLVRTKRRILPELSRALERRGIPHDPPSVRLADRPAVRLVLEVVAAAVGDSDPQGTDLRIRSILLGPLFGLGLARQRELDRVRRRAGRTWPDVLRREVPGAGPLADLLEDPSWAREMTASDGFWHLWTRLPQFEHLVEDPARPDWRLAWSSFAQTLGRQAERDPGVTLEDYLHRTEQEDFEAQPLLSLRPEEGDRLVLTTLHQAKGLEFDVVIVADAVEGVFPDLRSRTSLLEPRLLSQSQSPDPAATARFRIQEEMRLAYTAMTRARRRVVWTATAAGIDEGAGGVSRFLPMAVGVDSIDDLEREEAERQPVTYLEAEALLRSTARDPSFGPAERLAAMSVLAAGKELGLRSPQQFAGFLAPGSDRGLVPPDVGLSPTQAETFLECARRYALERRVGITDRASPYLALGSIIHEALEAAEKEAIDTGRARSTLDEALRHLGARWRPELFGGGPWAASWLRRAESILTHLYENWPSPGAAVAVEHPLELELDGTRWTGRADRIEVEEGEVRIVDYKTGTRLPTKEESATSTQLGFYLLAATRDPAVTAHGRPTQAELWYPAARQKGVAKRTFEYERLEEVRERLMEVGRSIKEEEWSPSPGPGCSHCSVKLVCPAWPEGREAYVR